MRLVSFELDGEQRVGLRKGDHVIDLSLAAPDLPRNLIGILTAGKAAMERITAVAENPAGITILAYDSLKFIPLIPRPPKIICIGRNYAAHAHEGGVEPPTYPEIFYRGATSLIGHNQPIIRPRCSDKLDYEAELVAIVGKRARHVKRADALSVIAGYSIFNEGTIRDYQRKSSQWTIGKNFDDTGAFGPEFVSADELPDGAHGLSIKTRLNGEVMQDANTRDFIFPVDELIEKLSECTTLEPGDIIITGTPQGVGYARTPPVFMKPGDICDVEIEGVGLLSNPIQDEIH